RDKLVTGVQTCALPILPSCLRGQLTQREHTQRQPRDRRDVLHAVDLIRDRSVHDLRAEVGLPQKRPGPRVERLKISIAAAREERSEERRVGKGWRMGWS